MNVYLKVKRTLCNLKRTIKGSVQHYAPKYDLLFVFGSKLIFSKILKKMVEKEPQTGTIRLKMLIKKYRTCGTAVTKTLVKNAFVNI